MLGDCCPESGSWEQQLQAGGGGFWSFGGPGSEPKFGNKKKKRDTRSQDTDDRTGNSTGSKCGARNNTDERFVFIFKKVNGSFEPFTAFKIIDVLDKFTNQYVVQMFKIEASIFQVFFTT